jgi:hypothetical protein
MKKYGLLIALFLLLMVTAGCEVTPPAEEDLADFGDAPDPKFPSLFISNGARHYDVATAWFGDDVDSELESNQVNNDRRDDGLISTDPISFTVTNKNWEGDLFVNILIDRNEDGDWENETNDGPDPNEWAVVNMKVEVPVGGTREFQTKVSVDDEIWMRMTLTTRPLRDWFGEGEFKVGETEDYIETTTTTTSTTTTTLRTTTTIRTPPPTVTIPPFTPVPPRITFSCSDNTWASKVGFNPFNMIGGICKDDCDPDETCDALSCTCEKKPKKEVQCSQGSTGFFGFSSFDPATEVCRNDCNIFTETCNQATCVCEPIVKENLCSRGPYYDDMFDAIPAMLNGEVCRDDCDKDTETCNTITCECEKKPPKEVPCSAGSDDYKLGYDTCKNDCKDNEWCSPISCVCLDLPKEVSCAGSEEFEYLKDICSDDCDEGLKCDTVTCTCEKPKKYSCSDQGTLTSDYSTDKSNFNYGVDICEDNCKEGEWCSSLDCSCEPKKEVLCTLGYRESSFGNIPYDSDFDVCKDNCPEGTVCNINCECIEVDEIVASCAFDTRPRNWNVCEDNCEIKGPNFLCNTESCVCEEYQTSFSCAQNTEDVDATDINNYPPPEPLPSLCITDDCPEGYECVESSCTCVKEKEIKGACLKADATATSETRPEGWNVCDSTTCPQGYTCNTAECVCEKDQVSCSDITIDGGTAYELNPSGLAACEETCLPPDECLILEGDPTCYYCQEFSCPPPTTEDSSCNNQCEPGYTCEEVQSSGCYQCECVVDLGFTGTSSSHFWSSSTTCIDSQCTTECSYEATYSVGIRNFGMGTSEGGSIMIDIGRVGGPMVMAPSTPFGSLGSGGTFDTEIVSMSLSGTVSGDAGSCSQLDFWVNVGQDYQVDYAIEGGGTDCDPSDNTVTRTRTLTDD